MVTLLNAVDYRLAGNRLEPKVFHFSIFFWYLVLGGVLLRFIYTLLGKVDPQSDHRLTALAITAFYLFHTSNAETINYIISRSDSFSTLCVVTTLATYQWKPGRRWGLYLLPLTIGMLTKEVVFMSAALIALYHFLIEEEALLQELGHRSGWKKLGRSFLSASPAWIVGLVLLFHNLVIMTDTSRLVGGLAHSRLDYFTSQFVVVTHYLGNFVLPINLSIDPDFQVTPEFLSAPKILGFSVILGLHLLAVLCVLRRVTTPIAFGIGWFFICLIPTSTIHPMHQVANDHRTFLPFIGLCLASGWAMFLFYSWAKKRSRLADLVPVVALVVIALHAWGVTQRNQVWGSDEALWAEAAAKGPNNGRAIMNYGLVKMKQGQYAEAEPLFQRALELLPTWPISNINLAILLNATGRIEEAEFYFKEALRYGPDSPEAYLYYARCLKQHGRDEQARDLLERGHEISPNHVKINDLLHEWKATKTNPADMIAQARQKAEEHSSADAYVELSLVLYRQKDFQGCIAACLRALELDPNNAYAYNNLSSAYSSLGLWEQAIAAGEKAVQLKPDFEIARNNLKWAYSGLEDK